MSENGQICTNKYETHMYNMILAYKYKFILQLIQNLLRTFYYHQLYMLRTALFCPTSNAQKHDSARVVYLSAHWIQFCFDYRVNYFVVFLCQ